MTSWTMRMSLLEMAGVRVDKDLDAVDSVCAHAHARARAPALTSAAA